MFGTSINAYTINWINSVTANYRIFNRNRTKKFLSHCSLIHFFVCQTYAVILLKLCLFEMGKGVFQEIVQLIVILFAAEFVVCFIVCISFFGWSFLEALLCTTIVMTLKHVFKRNITCLTEPFNCFSLFFFIMYPQSFLNRRAYYLVHSHRSALIFWRCKLCA